jgi:hypothetical protein
MARGWESKSVEEQQSLAKSPSDGKPQRSAAEQEKMRERGTIELAMAQVREQIERTQSEPRLKALRAALAELEAKLR